MGFVYFVIIMAVGIGMYFTGRSMGIEWALDCFLNQLVEATDPGDGDADESQA